MREELYIVNPDTFDVMTTTTGSSLADPFENAPAPPPLRASRMILFAETDDRDLAVSMSDAFERDVLQPCIEAETDGNCHIPVTKVRDFVDAYDRTYVNPPTEPETPPEERPGLGDDFGQTFM